MIQRFTKILERLEGKGKPLQTVAAVSGGVDSVVMAHLLNSCGEPFIVAHCNFQLRGVDSDMDEGFVSQLGINLGVEVLVKKFDTDRYANENGLSIQMAARELRYNWFSELVKEYGARIATAHHANDVAETVLFNLSKGTGIAGLHGISEQEETLIRPLLWATKEEIMRYATENNLQWQEDKSNESEKYMRNIIRKKIVPELERINPGFVKSTLRTVARIKESEIFLKYSIEKLGIVKSENGNYYLDKSKIKSLPGSASVLYNLISPYGFKYDQVQGIEESWGSSGACFYSKEWTLNIDREYLIISKEIEVKIAVDINKGESNIQTIDNSFLVNILDSNNYQLIDDRNMAALDLSKLKFPLLLRTWQIGDQFVPLGMNGKKKVSDFLIDVKMSVTEKKKQLVLVSEEQIVWLVGQRIDERVKITSKTGAIFQLIREVAKTK